jgi:hypothetical protein
MGYNRYDCQLGSRNKHDLRGRSRGKSVDNLGISPYFNTMGVREGIFDQ